MSIDPQVLINCISQYAASKNIMKQWILFALCYDNIHAEQDAESRIAITHLSLIPHDNTTWTFTLKDDQTECNGSIILSDESTEISVDKFSDSEFKTYHMNKSFHCATPSQMEHILYHQLLVECQAHCIAEKYSRKQ